MNKFIIPKLSIMILMLIFFALTLGVSSCSHAPYDDSFNSNVDEIIIKYDGELFNGQVLLNKESNTVSIKKPSHVDEVKIFVKADDYEQAYIGVTDYVDLFIPFNSSNVINVSMVTDEMKYSGTIFRELEDYTLPFTLSCGELKKFVGKGMCQLPFNADLAIQVEMQGKGNIALLSSSCDLKIQRKEVTGIQNFRIKGDFCQVILATRDDAGLRKASFLFRTATRPYIPISPIIKRDGQICAPDDVNYAEIVGSEEVIKRKKCIKSEGITKVILWDIQNSRVSLKKVD